MLQQISRVSRVGQVVQAGDANVDEKRWGLVLRRDRAADGRFVYAVTSTGVFCRPSCPSRRPHRDRVRFFETTLSAERAGYRACRRCHPTSPSATPSIADAIRRAAQYLTQRTDEVVSLRSLAGVARLSPSHLQRQFKQALGVSPREYQAACRAARFRGELQAGRNVTEAMYEAGYGSPSRIYEASPTGRGMKPAAYRRGGIGIEVGFTSVRCDLGWLLVAATDKGVCAVKLGDTQTSLEADLRRELPAAQLSPDRFVQPQWVKAIVNGLQGSGRALDLPLDVRGTAFQWRVWRALQRIRAGDTRSYSDVARAIGRPSAARAVARACATNPVCLVVPCHRVTGKNGELGGYRWGTKRKEQLLAREAAGAPGNLRRPRKSK